MKAVIQVVATTLRMEKAALPLCYAMAEALSDETSKKDFLEACGYRFDESSGQWWPAVDR